MQTNATTNANECHNKCKHMPQQMQTNATTNVNKCHNKCKEMPQQMQQQMQTNATTNVNTCHNKCNNKCKQMQSFASHMHQTYVKINAATYVYLIVWGPDPARVVLSYIYNIIIYNILLIYIDICIIYNIPRNPDSKALKAWFHGIPFSKLPRMVTVAATAKKVLCCLVWSWFVTMFKMVTWGFKMLI